MLGNLLSRADRELLLALFGYPSEQPVGCEEGADFRTLAYVGSVVVPLICLIQCQNIDISSNEMAQNIMRTRHGRLSGKAKLLEGISVSRRLSRGAVRR